MSKPEASGEKLLRGTLAATCGLLLSLGCAASTDAGPERPGSPSTTSTSTAPPNPIPVGARPPPVVAACGTAVTPGPTSLRRLSNEELLRSLRDIFSLTPAELAQLELPSEGLATNLADGRRVTPQNLRSYLRLAYQVSDFALNTPERRAALAACDLTLFECRKEFSWNLGVRMFRDAIPEQRVWDLEAVAARAVPSVDPDPYRPAKLMIMGLITSPRFLFQVENPTGDGSFYPWKSIGSWGMSTRLSYMLWGTNPDKELLDEALAQRLAQPGGVETATRRMLADPRAKEGIGRFLSRWLGVDDVATAVRSQAQYPEWTPALQASLQEETARFLEDFWVAPGANLLDSLTATYSYVDGTLAPLYGVQAPGAGFGRVDFSDGTRGGLLTQGALLTASVSGSELVAPILRGKFIRERFLCTLPLPEALPGIPSISTDPSLTTRERLELHTSAPACKSCHELLDPVGLGFEQYDLVGRYRATGAVGEALTGAGKVVGLPGDPTFTGPAGLAAVLKGSDEVAACVAHQTLRYGLGRELLPSEACGVTIATEALKASNYSLQEMIVAIVRSDAFRMASFTTGTNP